MVFVEQDNIPRLLWPLGIICKVFPGKDGVVRSVDVKVKNKIVGRPVQPLHKLELVSEVFSPPTPQTSHTPCTQSIAPNTHTHTRSGRKVTKPNRLNL